jgi:hypothetical protein
MTGNCTTGFSLLETHACTLNPSIKPTVKLSANPTPAPIIPGSHSALASEPSDSAQKRKASTPDGEEGHSEKRQKTDDANNLEVEEKNSDGASTLLLVNACRFTCEAPSLTLHLLASTSRRASVRGANSDAVESNKKGAKRVKSPKSKSPAPAVPQSASSSAPENEGVSDSIIQLKGHEAEVCGRAML